MAEEKTFTDLIDEAHYRSHVGPPLPFPAKRAYKKLWEKEPPSVDCEIGAGSRVICSTGPNEPEYYLCCVIDMEDAEDFWTTRTRFIVQILDASTDSGREQIGRLRTARVQGGFSPRHGLQLVEVGKANWGDYLPSGN